MGTLLKWGQVKNRPNTCCSEKNQKSNSETATMLVSNGAEQLF